MYEFEIIDWEDVLSKICPGQDVDIRSPHSRGALIPRQGSIDANTRSW
jgi:hypothetical protein